MMNTEHEPACKSASPWAEQRLFSLRCPALLPTSVAHILSLWGLILTCLVPTSVVAQKTKVIGSDTLKLIELSPTIVEQHVSFVIAPMKPVEGVFLTRGKTSEQWRPDPGISNAAANVGRQIFAKVPGAVFWETDYVQTNIAIRGLSPHRSGEFSVRMNGYDIASDPFGYPEAHFNPPIEAVEQIQLIRGSAALQFGPQFGGMLNYVMKKGRQGEDLSTEFAQTIGSFGFSSTFASLSGSSGDLTFYSFGNYRRGSGWRSSSTIGTAQQETDNFNQVTGGANLQYRLSPRTTLGFEQTAMWYLMRQPGGLDSAQYASDPQRAFRTRDWFAAPRAYTALTLDHEFSASQRLRVTANGHLAQRNSLGLITSTTILDTGTNRRRLNTDSYAHAALESRLISNDSLFGTAVTSATGMRISHTNTHRFQGLGADGSEYSLERIGPGTRDLEFATTNAALFAESEIKLSEAFWISPGLRVEYLRIASNSVFTDAVAPASEGAFNPLGPVRTDAREPTQAIPLLGIGATWQTSDLGTMHANYSQAFRPALYSDQFQNDPIPVDSALGSSRGYTLELGYRYDSEGIVLAVSAFSLFYGGRIGIDKSRPDLYPQGIRSEIGASRHNGFEWYLEKFYGPIPIGEERYLSLSASSSGSILHARYAQGIGLPAFWNKTVENAPPVTLRHSLEIHATAIGRARITNTYVGQTFSDPFNTVSSRDGWQGLIPAYSLFDVSLVIDSPMKGLAIEMSVTNLLDNRYFTRRATQYPGPGILPGDGRSIFVGARYRAP